MLKLAVLVCLIALGAAQTPPTKPKIPETFISEGMVDVHRNRQQFKGEGHISRDQMGGKGVERVEHKEGQTDVVYEHLERYDMNEEFRIENNNTQKHCEHMATKGSLPPFWGWLEMAKHETRPHMNKTLDFWEAEVGGVRLEVGVDEKNPDTPVVFTRFFHGMGVTVMFTAFEPTMPPEAFFTIPSECSMKKN